jgi:hypothetical protein
MKLLINKVLIQIASMEIDVSFILFMFPNHKLRLKHILMLEEACV